MNSRAIFSALLALLVLVSCTTQPSQQPKLAGWPGSEVYMMPRWTFMAETLELKDGRFRYWFSSDVITPGSPRYPLVGTYICSGDELVLSGGKVFKVRQINEKRVLFWPHAVGDWDHEQIIPGHMLLPVESIDSEPPTNQGFFTREQIDTSERKARELVERRK